MIADVIKLRIKTKKWCISALSITTLGATIFIKACVCGLLKKFHGFVQCVTKLGFFKTKPPDYPEQPSHLVPKAKVSFPKSDYDCVTSIPKPSNIDFSRFKGFRKISLQPLLDFDVT